MKPKHDPSIKKQCDKLWIEIIKLKAGYKSELCGALGKKAGGNEVITSHHILGKPNLRLRYDLQNGICLINGREHIFGVHNKSNPVIANHYFQRIKDYIGEDRYNYLKSLTKGSYKIDLKITKIYLQQQFDELLRTKIDSE